MPWLEAALPARMTRVALVAPAEVLRDMLVLVAGAAAVEIDRPDSGQDPDTETARRLAPAGSTSPSPAVCAYRPDLDELERSGRYDLLAGEAQLQAYAAAAVRGSGSAALAGWIPAARREELTRQLAPLGCGVIPLPRPRTSEAPTLLDGSARRRIATEVHPAGPAAASAVIASVGGTAVPLTASWPVRTPRPYTERLAGDAPLRTGQRVVDVLFPVSRGGTTAVPGGFGTGKTVLLQQITKWCEADVIVYVGCGERGNELADMLAELAGLADPRTGGLLAQRTVVIANTSNMPMMAREASIYSAACVAEHFRDMGLDVVVVADSTSRWAEALREFASRSGELPAEEGYPASLASALAAFYERAGRVITTGGREGSITIIGAVSPAGGDMTEPVTTYTQRFVRCLWTLDRDLAYARHYPAVSWAGSFSRDAAAIGGWHARNGDPGWSRRRSRLAALLADADRLGELAELMGVTALPPGQRVTILAGRLVREGVLQQSALSPVDAACAPDRAAALADAVLAVARRCQELADRGVPPATIEDQDFAALLRAKDEAATPQDVLSRQDELLARLDALEAQLAEPRRPGPGAVEAPGAA